jgi:hypothetical protein
MRLSLRYFGLLTLQCSALLSAAQAQTSLESIPIRHQSAQSVADQLQPKLKAGEYAVASGNSILLNAQTTEIAGYRSLVASLDQPIKRWLLEMRQGNLALLQKDAVPEGEVTISNRGANGLVMIGNAAGELQNRTITQSMQVLDGSKISIALGNAKPLVLRTTAALADGSVGTEASGLQIAEQSGLWAAPYQRDERNAILEIAPRSLAISNEEMPIHSSALLTVPLGQWTTLAQADVPESRVVNTANTKTSSSPYVVQARLTLLP